LHLNSPFPLGDAGGTDAIVQPPSEGQTAAERLPLSTKDLALCDVNC
jgi:hypothetical protein